MVIPVYDENGQLDHGHPWVMWTLLGINIVIVIYLWLLSAQGVAILSFNFGVVPAFITSSVDTESLNLLMPPALTFVTYMFLHGGWVHLAGNMIFLWVFGDNIETALGHFRFLLFYLLCGIAGAAAHVASMPGSVSPLIGASAAVAGIVSAYVMLRPWAHITVLLLGIVTFRVHALWLLGAWAGWQVLHVLLLEHANVSYWSHVGGLAAGAGLVVFMRRPGVKLFQRHIAHRIVPRR